MNRNRDAASSPSSSNHHEDDDARFELGFLPNESFNCDSNNNNNNGNTTHLNEKRNRATRRSDCEQERVASRGESVGERSDATDGAASHSTPPERHAQQSVKGSSTRHSHAAFPLTCDAVKRATTIEPAPPAATLEPLLLYHVSCCLSPTLDSLPAHLKRCSVQSVSFSSPNVHHSNADRDHQFSPSPPLEPSSYRLTIVRLNSPQLKRDILFIFLRFVFSMFGN